MGRGAPNFVSCVRLHVAPGAPRTTARRGRGGVVERPFPLQRNHHFPLRGRGTPGLRQGHSAPCPPEAHKTQRPPNLSWNGKDPWWARWSVVSRGFTTLSGSASRRARRAGGG